MIVLAKREELLAASSARQLWEHNDDKVLIFQRDRLIFAFNFHPTQSFSDYQFQAPPRLDAMVGCFPT